MKAERAAGGSSSSPHPATGPQRGRASGVHGALQSSARGRGGAPYPPPRLTDPLGPALIPQKAEQAGRCKVRVAPIWIRSPFRAPEGFLLTVPRCPASHPTPASGSLPCLLLAATLGALGSAGVVAQHSSEAQGHSCVTAIHGHHGHLLLRWALGEPCLAQQRLWTEGREGKQWQELTRPGTKTPGYTDTPLCPHMCTHMQSHDLRA